MKYIKYILIVITSVLISIIDIFYTIFIIPFRHRARIVVYNYSKYNKIYIHNLIYNKSKQYNIFVYYTYFIFVWIWLDDNLDTDIVDQHIAFKIYKDTKLPKIIKDIVIKETSSYSYINILKPFINLERVISTNINVSLLTVYLTILYNKNNNFRYRYFYTTDINDVFLIKLFGYKFGWKESLKQNYNFTTVYELVLLDK